jgi:hypothetical protein
MLNFFELKTVEPQSPAFATAGLNFDSGDHAFLQFILAGRAFHGLKVVQ